MTTTRNKPENETVSLIFSSLETLREQLSKDTRLLVTHLSNAIREGLFNLDDCREILNNAPLVEDTIEMIMIILETAHDFK